MSSAIDAAADVQGTPAAEDAPVLAEMERRFTGTINKVSFKLGPSELLAEDHKAAQ